MTQAVYLVGAPGTGKSTAMDALVELLGLEWMPDERVWREVWVNPLANRSGVVQALSLGKRRDAYSGTDALSMSASPRVLEWVAATPLPSLLLGEGARLGTTRFLPRLHQMVPTLVVHLVCSPEEEEQRVAARGGGLSERYCASRRTASANAADACRMLGMPVLEISTTENSSELVAEKIFSEMPLFD